MEKAKVFNIQRFSLNDGPGIRTVVFVKGCPLSCLWCHNPESKSRERSLLYDKKACILCGGCAAACPSGCHTLEDGVHIMLRSECSVCGKCADACPSTALEICGSEMSAEQALAEVKKDSIFYETSGGGVTVSGGEPLYSFDFTYELLSLARASGLHTAMETSGFAPEERIRKAAEVCDLFLYDYKETDPDLHREFCGVDNRLILSNLRLLDSLGARVILRCPIIPGKNDREEHFDGIGAISRELSCIEAVEVEPYHPLGESKADSLGADYPLKGLGFPEKEVADGWVQRIAAKTSKPVRKG